jgi:hypothetical protein
MYMCRVVGNLAGRSSSDTSLRNISGSFDAFDESQPRPERARREMATLRVEAHLTILPSISHRRVPTFAPAMKPEIYSHPGPPGRRSAGIAQAGHEIVAGIFGIGSETQGRTR